MNSTASTFSATQPRRRWPIYVILTLLGCVGLAIGAAWLLNDRAERDWENALAEADQLDPGWRFEELEANRAAVPDEQNAARRVLAASALLPSPWPTWPDMPILGADEIEKQLRELQPNMPLKVHHVEALRGACTAAGAALAEARTLKDLPAGRYPSVRGAGSREWNEHWYASHTVADLLAFDAMLRQHDRDPQGAFDSCRALVNLARSFGDEPSTRAQLARLRVRLKACATIERTLAQGQPSVGAVVAMQQLLEDEEAQPLLLHGFRGLRIEMYDFVEAMAEGRVPMERVAEWAKPITLQRIRPVTLRVTTNLVEAAKRPFAEQLEAIHGVMPARSDVPAYFASHVYPSIEKSVSDLYPDQRRSRALLRCTIAALAVERYRRDKRALPESLPELVPAYLRAVPTDPYDDQPVRYRKSADGVVIYCVGSDKLDNQGQLDRTYTDRNGQDVGIQLWKTGAAR